MAIAGMNGSAMLSTSILTGQLKDWAFLNEGTFRQALIVKGRNRDTAWFAVIDMEWENLEQCFLRYLSEENFDENWVQKFSLASLTNPLLYKVDE